MNDTTKKPLDLTTRAYKGRDGWQAETIIALEDRGGKDGWKLTLRTSKASRGGISCYASTSRHGDGFVQTRIFRDFGRTVITRADKRCTEKNIKDLHEEVLTQHLTAVLNAELEWEADQLAKEHADRREAA